jgi:hypothetical protein
MSFKSSTPLDNIIPDIHTATYISYKMKFTLTQFFKSQFTTLPESSTFLPDLTGRVVIVTGSNVGLGFECAKALSHRNPSRLILAVRNVEAGEAAAREIVKANPPGGGVKTIPEVWKLDLGDLASVKAFGERAEKELDRLDIVVSTTSFDSELISDAPRETSS